LECGTTLITFNNTCYGRLLGQHAGYDGPPISAADCYRYTLSQPGVTACLTAPSSLEELEENLTALSDPRLTDETVAVLRAVGDLAYREDTLFRKLVRAL
jgi:predicted aldo/keto reductase-like oxidoreductase